MKSNERAYQVLRDEIVSSMLEPGTVLGEVETSERLGVSRTPVREALFRLEVEGLVTPNAGRGVVVAELSLADIRKLYELRLALEGQAARLAAAQRDEAVFRRLQARFHHVRVELAADEIPGEYFGLLRECDGLVEQASANQYLAAALRVVRPHLVRIRTLAKNDRARLVESLREVEQIVDAIADGDPELAEAATRVHLSNSLAYTLEAASRPSVRRHLLREFAG